MQLLSKAKKKKDRERERERGVLILKKVYADAYYILFLGHFLKKLKHFIFI